MGFVNDVVPDDKVVEAAVGIATSIAAMSRLLSIDPKQASISQSLYWTVADQFSKVHTTQNRSATSGHIMGRTD